jgi:hypothetical protein
MIIILFGLFGAALSLTVLFRYYVEFRDDGLFVSLWLLVPVKVITIPYDRITSVEIDQSDASVGIQFVSDSGESEVVPFRPRSSSAASRLRDEIRLRQSSSVDLGDVVEKPHQSPVVAHATDLPTGSSKLRFEVEKPGWIRWLFLAGAIMMPAFVLADGNFSFGAVIFSILFGLALGAFLSLVFVRSSRLIIRSNGIEAGSGGESGRVNYSSISDVQFTPRGWLGVKYEKLQGFPPRRREATISVRIRPPAEAARAAAIIKAGMDRALEAKNQPQLPR